MKKVLAVLVLTLAALPATAQWHHGYHGGYYRGGGWVAPAIIGGAIGYGLSRPYYSPYYYPPVIVEQPPIIVQQPPVYIQQPAQNCGPWIETLNLNGTISRTRT